MQQLRPISIYRDKFNNTIFNPSGTDSVKNELANNATWIVKNIVICNYTADPATVSVLVLESTPEFPAFNQIPIVFEYAVQPYDTLMIETSVIVDPGQSVQIIKTGAGFLAVHISGVEVS
jgi:hypothetical protein